MSTDNNLQFSNKFHWLGLREERQVNRDAPNTNILTLAFTNCHCARQHRPSYMFDPFNARLWSQLFRDERIHKPLSFRPSGIYSAR